MRSVWVLTVAFALALPPSPSAKAEDSSGPSWFKRKKQIKKQKEEEQAIKDNERPAVDGDRPADREPTPLVQTAPVQLIAPNLLFKREGLTDSLGLDYGTLSQPDLGGKALSIQYMMGWWWLPNLVAGFFGRESTILDATYLFMLMEVGPMIRYLPSDHWMLSGMLGYSYSQGLTRVSAAHLPPPPTPNLLAARHGFYFGTQATYLFWPSRSLCWGPTLNLGYGTQSERKLTMISLGIMFQSGRPNYRGEVTPP